MFMYTYEQIHVTEWSLLMCRTEMEMTTTGPEFFGNLGLWTGRTELHHVASLGNALQLERLIDGGASVNAVTADNITPLHDACAEAQPQCAKLLLAAGAQVDIRTIHGSTPLCNACAAGSLECAKLLLEHGASVNPSLTALTASPLHEACIRGARVNAASFHETALHYAAKVGNVDLIQMLVEFGGNVYAQDNLGKKPIDYTGPGSPTAACLEFYESNPLSLQQMSRACLRMALGTRAQAAASRLQLSQRIIDYLCYR
ncbi:ankyrin repeat and SOCS box protein 13-like isoform X2 [Brienomyrus brachyistius]|uniref:ankyrin repeat and SOCS box protein 13-like isoform X2 n=1 Tax=Brienomyrus brachyistius TaxID=42636 RepID=UPI0020B45409|nr:ankyrin repeat and SOCS box protein 13-like isoform X2 [Brienomyrus brachyistius]